jgi:hypothetical protein
MHGITIESYAALPKTHIKGHKDKHHDDHHHEHKQEKSSVNLMLFKAMNPNHML